MAIAALALVLTACFGGSLPKCDAPVAIDLLGQVYADAFQGTRFAGTFTKVRLENTRTTLELFYQRDPEIRGCRTTVTFSFDAPPDGLYTRAMLNLGATRANDGRLYVSEVAKSTIEWLDKSSRTIWLEVH